MLRLMAWSVGLRCARNAQVTKVLFKGHADQGSTYLGNQSGPRVWHKASGVLPHVLTISAYAQAEHLESFIQVALRCFCPRLAGLVIITYGPPADVKQNT